MTRQGLGDKAYSVLQVPSQWTILHASQVLPVSSSNIVLYILVFVYYGFYERTFFYYMYIFKMGKTIKKKKKEKEVCAEIEILAGH